MKENDSTEELYDNEIDLSSIVAVLWQRRKLIAFGTLGATLLAIGVSLLLPPVYRSEGFYQLGNPVWSITLTAPKKTEAAKTTAIGVPVPIYKSSSTLFFDSNRFKLIASQNKLFKKEDLKNIEEDIRTAQDINKWIKPVYAFAKDDTREFAQMPKDEFNSVLGLHLAYEADSSENAAVHVNFFGNYIRDCLLYVTLFNYIKDGYSNAVTAVNKIENEITGLQFELLQNTNKMKDIRDILTKYPESAKIDNRQLVSVQDGGSRFLSPVTQLVGVESTLADIRQSLANLNRDREKLSVRSEYFSRCDSEFAKIGENGNSLFSLLKSIKDEIFKNKNISKDEVKEVFNNLNIDMQMFEYIFFQNSRFISGPTVPTAHIKPRKSLIAIASCLASFFILVIFVLGSHWWKRNKSVIMSTPSL